MRVAKVGVAVGALWTNPLGVEVGALEIQAAVEFPAEVTPGTRGDRADLVSYARWANSNSGALAAQDT